MKELTKSAPVAAAQKPSALGLMASRLSIEPAKLLSTLKATVFKSATDEEVAALVMVANEYGLNPLLKEVYAFPAKGGGIIPIVSVDGWNKMLIRHPQFDGIKFTFEHDANGPTSCTSTVYVKGRSHPVEITEYFAECVRPTDNWQNMPHRMLRNRTLCQASRMAFGFSGLSHEDEAHPVEIDAIVHPAELPPRMVAAQSSSAPSHQVELEAIVIGAGYTFDDLIKWGENSGNIKDGPGSFADIKTSDATRILRAKDKFLASLAAFNEVQP